LQPNDGTRRQSTPCHDSASDGDNDDEAEPPRVKPKARRSGPAIRHGIRHPPGSLSVESNNENEAEAVQQSDGQDSPRRRLGRRRHAGTMAEDESMYHPSEGSEREPDEEDDDGLRQPLRKRPKVSPFIQSSPLRTATRRQIRSNGGVSRPRQARKSAPSRMYKGRRSIASPLSSQGSNKEKEPAETFVAMFEERQIEAAVLKAAIVNGVATFQLQWSQDLACANHRPEDRASGSQRCKPLPKRRSSADHQARKNPLPKRTEGPPTSEINDQEE